MSSQYRTINGIRYERDLLALADREAASSKGRPLSQAVAEKIWSQAMDGNKVTDTERRTIEKIMQEYNIESAGKSFLQKKLKDIAQPPLQQPAQRPANLRGSVSKKYYKTIKGVKYDNALIEHAEAIVAREGSISFKMALKLWAEAHDGSGVTECERRTLHYIVQNLQLALNAKEKFLAVLEAPPGEVAQLRLGDAMSESLAEAALGDRSSSSLQGRPERSRRQSRSRSRGGRRASANADADPRFDFGFRFLPPRCAACNSLSWNRGCKAEGKVFCRTCFERHLPKCPGVAIVGALTACGDQGAIDGAAPELASLVATRTAAASSGTSSSFCSGLASCLAPEIQELLREEDAGPGHTFEIMDAAAVPRDDELERKKAEARIEVDRIIAAKRVGDLLGGGPKEAQHREFRRLALLVHPDKPWAISDDSFNLAYRLILAAKRKSG